jgi:hypothetical protein
MKNQRISDFRREGEQNWALLSFYARSTGKFLQTFRDDQRSQLQGDSRHLKMVSIVRPETLTGNYQYLARNDSEACSSVLKIAGIFRCRISVTSVKIHLQTLWFITAENQNLLTTSIPKCPYRIYGFRDFWYRRMSCILGTAMLCWAEWHKISSAEGEASLINADGTWQAV